MRNIEDNFTFKVRSGEQSSGVEKFSIFYVPGISKSGGVHLQAKILFFILGDTNVDITLERLEVEEGSRRTISKRYLFIRAAGHHHFIFNVTKSPHHGQIDVLSTNKVDVDRPRATYFTSEEISEERIVYKHDDSESRRDTFHFLVSSDRHDFQYVGVFHIHVILRNDQTPTRVIDKEFQVITFTHNPFLVVIFRFQRMRRFNAY